MEYYEKKGPIFFSLVQAKPHKAFVTDINMLKSCHQGQTLSKHMTTITHSWGNREPSRLKRFW
jgi:hypothetical protein